MTRFENELRRSLSVELCEQILLDDAAVIVRIAL